MAKNSPNDKIVIQNGSISFSVADVVSAIQMSENIQYQILNSIEESNKKLLESSILKVKLRSKKLSAVRDIVSDHITSLMEVINSVVVGFTSNSNTNSLETIKQMFGYMEEKQAILDDNGRPTGREKVISSRFLLIDGLIAVMGVFDKTAKFIETIAKSDMGIANMLFLKRKISIFTRNIFSLSEFALKELVKMSSMVDRDTIDALMGPETTLNETSSERIAQKATEKGITKEFTKDVNHNKTQTTKKYGILEVMEKYLNLGNMLNNMELPNIIKTFVKLKLYGVQIKMLISNIKQICAAYADRKTVEDIQIFGESFEIVADSIQHMDVVVSSLVDFGKTLNKNKRRIRRALNLLWNPEEKVSSEDAKDIIMGKDVSILTYLVGILNSPQYSKFKDKRTKNKIEEVQETIEDFIKSLLVVADLGKPAIWLRIKLANSSVKTLGKLLSGLCKLAEEMVNGDNFSVETFENANKILKEVKEFVSNLRSIALNICLIGVLSLAAIVLLVPTILFVVMLAGFIKIINYIGELLDENTIKEINNTIGNISSIILKLALIALATIVLGVISIIAIPAMLPAILFVLLMTLFIVVISKLLDAIDNSVDIMSLLKVLAVLGILAVMALAVLVINNIGEKIKILNVLSAMGGILVSIIFCTLIGIAAVALSAIAIPAMIGIGMTLLMIGMIALVALALQGILSVKLNKKEVQDKIKDIMSCAKLAISAILVDDTEEPEEQGGWLARGLKFIGGAAIELITIILRFATLSMIFLCVGLIFFIAKSLSSLQNIKLDAEKIKSTVKTVIEVGKSIPALLFEKQEEGEKDESKGGPLSALFDFLGGTFQRIKTFIDIIISVPVLLACMMNVGIVMLIANMLNKLSEITIDDNINKKVKQIIDVAKNVSDLVLGKPAEKPKEAEPQGFWGKLGSFAKKAGNFVKGVVGGVLELGENILSGTVLASVLPNIMILSQVVDAIKAISELQFNKTEIEQRSQDIVSLAKYISSVVSGNDSGVSTIDEDKVEAFEDYVDAAVKYVDCLNKIDINKVKTVADMYSKMAEFMDKLQGAPIDDIADALVNKISPALSEISETMSDKTERKISSPVDIMQYHTNNSLGLSEEAASTEKTTVAEMGKSQNSNTSIDYKGILENIEDLLEQIKNKLNAQQPLTTF